MKAPGSAALCALFASILLGCSTTEHSSEQMLSGFLSNYDRMERSEPDKAATWRSPSFSLDDYDAVWVERVELWDVVTGTGSDVDAMAPADAQRLAAIFRKETVARLREQGWALSAGPGKRVLALRMALTELNGANRFGNVLASNPHVAAPGTQIPTAHTDVYAFVGKASVELQLTYSSSGAILAEAYDRRVGVAKFSKSRSTWADVEDAIEYFADRIAVGLSKGNR